MLELTLYQRPNCPYCQKVLHYLETNDITVPMKNLLENPDYRQELITKGGKAQVPCLLIDGQPLYESDDIIAWFEANRSLL